MLQGLMKESFTGGASGPKAVGGGKGTNQDDKTTQRDAVSQRRQHDPNARTLDIQPEELEHIERLAPLLDRSPRALKRFVNVYRLMKASLPAEEQDAFLEEDGPLVHRSRPCCCCSPVVNGLPALSDVLLQALLSAPASNQDPERSQPHLERSSTVLRRGLAQRMRCATGWLDREVGVGWRTADPARFLTWVPQVARDHHLHRGRALKDISGTLHFP